jgi:uncharacterized protein YqfB (UPF0267 family)
MIDLWNTARQYGLVRLTTTEDGKYYCCIKFSTIAHVTLEAKSDFDCANPQEALIQAINRAVQIVSSISEPIARLKELTNGKSTST